MSESSTTTPARLPALDGLRGIAVLLVIGFHLIHLERAQGVVERLALAPLRFGWAGVDLFFVLSGFLITGLLLDAKGSDGYFRVFYSRRALRIFPLYYVTLAVLFGLFSAFGGNLAGDPASRPAWYFFYVSNVVMALKGFPALPLSHFWSLAIEEQFYLAWPLVVLVLSRRALGGVAAALVALVPVVRTGFFLAGVAAIPLYVLTPFRLDALAAGAFAAVLYRARPVPETKKLAAGAFAVGALSLCALLAVAPNPLFFAPAMVTVGYTLLAITFAGAVLLCATASPEGLARTLASVPLQATGRFSYAMYVFHWPVIWAFRSVGFAPGPLSATLGGRLPAFLAYAAGTLAAIYALAAASWFLLERPCLALKDRIEFGPRRLESSE